MIVTLFLLLSCLVVADSGLPIDIHIDLTPTVKSNYYRLNHYITSVDVNNQVKFSQSGANPHVTLFLTDFKSDAYSNITSTLKSYVKNYKGPMCKLNTDTAVLSGSYGMWNIQNNKCLQSISNDIVLAISQYRTVPSPIPSWLAHIPEPKRSEMIKMIKEYGSPVVFQFFQPHVTLAWDNITTSLLEPIFSDSEFPPSPYHSFDYDWKMSSVSMGQVGPHGTVVGPNYQTFTFNE